MSERSTGGVGWPWGGANCAALHDWARGVGGGCRNDWLIESRRARLTFHGRKNGEPVRSDPGHTIAVGGDRVTTVGIVR